MIEINLQNDLFKQASKLQLCFTTPGRTLSVDDLWKLPLQSTTGKISLNSIAQSIAGQLQATTKSFVSSVVKTDEQKLNELRLEILKAVIAEKMADNSAAVQKKQKQDQKAFLRQLLEKKEIEALMGLSAEEIQQKLKELGED